MVDYNNTRKSNETADYRGYVMKRTKPWLKVHEQTCTHDSITICERKMLLEGLLCSTYMTINSSRIICFHHAQPAAYKLWYVTNINRNSQSNLSWKANRNYKCSTEQITDYKVWSFCWMKVYKVGNLLFTKAHQGWINDALMLLNVGKSMYTSCLETCSLSSELSTTCLQMVQGANNIVCDFQADFRFCFICTLSHDLISSSLSEYTTSNSCCLSISGNREISSGRIVLNCSLPMILRHLL